jgi:hypothetical protein
VVTGSAVGGAAVEVARRVVVAPAMVVGSAVNSGSAVVALTWAGGGRRMEAGGGIELAGAEVAVAGSAVGGAAAEVVRCVRGGGIKLVSVCKGQLKGGPAVGS